MIALPIYEPPSGDEPLDAIEQALVRALVPILVREIREAAARRLELERRRIGGPGGPLL